MSRWFGVNWYLAEEVRSRTSTGAMIAAKTTRCMADTLLPFVLCQAHRWLAQCPFLISAFSAPDNALRAVRAYPELSAVVGGQVPDLRGLFLRGHGGNSAALGVRQGDAIRNITGNFSVHHGMVGGGSDVFRPQFPGNAVANSGGGFGYYSLIFDASSVVPTAEENRPVNQAVRYLIRALP